MRKNSMRARIHVIRDLLKKIKELQQKKSKTDAQKAQNERKTSRLQSEVTIIKQLKKDKYKKKVKMLGRVASGNVCNQRGCPV